MTIRDAIPDDLEAIRAIYNHSVLNDTATADYDPRSAEAQIAWFDGYAVVQMPVLVAERDDRVVGWGALSPFNPRPGYRYSVTNSVYIAPDCLGQGIGAQVLAELIERARALKLHSIIASIDSENVASLRLHARYGFQEVARYRELVYKFDRWLDVVHLQCLI